MTTLTLCPGNAPKASQVCLLFDIFNKFFVLAPARVNTREPLRVSKPFLYYLKKEKEKKRIQIKVTSMGKRFTDVRISLALQLFLHFSVGSAPSAGMEMDIIVEKTCTVKEVSGGKKCT